MWFTVIKSPFLIAVSAAVVGLLLACLLVFWKIVAPGDVDVDRASAHGAPWQVEVPAAGHSVVMGLKLPGTSLRDVSQRWGSDLKLALIVGNDGSLALEGYLETWEAGGVTGRLLLSFDVLAEEAAIQRWRDVLPGVPMASGGRQHALTADAVAALASAGLAGVSFIPMAQLDAHVLTARFGHPAERVSTQGRLEHWLYPAQGLAVVLDSEGREVLQYVAPADFDRLLAAPLRADQGAR